MDGRSCPITIGPLVVQAIRPHQKPLDVHLMIVEPDRYVADFRNAGADFITVHGTCPHLHRSVQNIRSLGQSGCRSIHIRLSMCWNMFWISSIWCWSCRSTRSVAESDRQCLSQDRADRKMIDSRGLPTLIEVDGVNPMHGAVEVVPMRWSVVRGYSNLPIDRSH